MHRMEIVPVPPADQMLPIKNMRTRTFFIVDEYLDEITLRASLDSLIRNHWRKLGGRLGTQSDKGWLEYHIPHKFGENDVLFHWSSRKATGSINKVAGSIRSPDNGNGPMFLPSMATIDSWFRPSDWPYDRNDDFPVSPLLFVHLSLFDDASVICTSLPHVVSDQMGLANIMRAWMGLIDGKAPPTLVGYSGEDLLPGSGRSYLEYPINETFQIGKHRIYRMAEYPLVLLPFIYDLIVNFKEEQCVLFLPRPLIQSLRDRHSSTLLQKHGQDCSNISDGDIITAILVKFARMNKTTPCTVSLVQTISLQGRIPKLAAAYCDGFIHNAVHHAISRVRMDQSTPISKIAYANRKAIEVALDARDIEIGSTVVREMVRRDQSHHICEPFEMSYNVSNWSAAWRDLDFSPAVAEEYGMKDGSAKRPKFLVLGQAKARSTPLRFSASIMSRTDQGYWAEFSTSTAAMKLVKEYLIKDPLLVNF